MALYHNFLGLRLPADTDAEAERLEAAVVVPEQDSTSACCGERPGCNSEYTPEVS